LRALAVNAHSFWIGVDKPDDLAGMTLATSWGDSLGPLQKRGEPWRVAEPKEGMPCWVDNYAIAWTLREKPFLKQVAEEYINGLLSTDYQVEHIMRHMSLTPIITNIEARLTSEERGRLHIGTADFFEKNRILHNIYSKRDRNGLKVLWQEAMQGIPTTRGKEK
jgi:spermidine/putrescine-binding protein